MFTVGKDLRNHDHTHYNHDHNHNDDDDHHHYQWAKITNESAESDESETKAVSELSERIAIEETSPSSSSSYIYLTVRFLLQHNQFLNSQV